MEYQLLNRLGRVQRRLRQSLAWKRIAIFAVFVGAVCLSLSLIGDQISREGALAIAGVVALTGIVIWRMASRHYGSLNEVASRIENVFPELQQRLVTSVAQLKLADDRPRGYLESKVMQEALLHGLHHRWTAVVPGRGLWLSRLVALIGLAAAGYGIWSVYRQPLVVSPVVSTNPEEPKSTTTYEVV